MTNHHDDHNGNWTLKSLDDFTIETLDRSEEEIHQDLIKIIKLVFNDNHYHQDNLRSSEQENIKITRQTGGNTNRLYRIDLNLNSHHDDHQNDGGDGRRRKLSVLVRINGLETEKIINRESELFHMIQLDKQHVGAKLFAIFKNGFVYEYVEGKPIETASEIIQHLKGIAEQLARWHVMKIQSDDTTPSLFKTLYKWIDQLKDLSNNKDDKEKLFEKEDYSLERIELEVKRIETQYFKTQPPLMLNSNSNDLTSSTTFNPFSIGFCHNDLVSLNIIASTTSGGDGAGRIHFIDCEYCAYNYIGFDIGNFFNEFCGFQMDRSLYPDRQVQNEFIRYYLESMISCSSSGSGSSSSVVKDEVIEKFVISLPIFSQLSHLFWGLWAKCQSHYSNLDFDYKSYSNGRLKWYFEVEQQQGFTSIDHDQ